MTNCNDVDTAIAKIKKSAIVKAQIPDSCDIISSPRIVIDKWIKLMRFKDSKIPGLKSDSDLISGQYEGGFKIWESTYDLISFINEDKNVIGHLLSQNRKIRVLELGAGSSLATIAFINRLFAEPKFDSNYRIHIQDYNWQVLCTLSLINLALNLPLDYLTQAMSDKSIRMFSGDWKKFNYRHKYHLIMMSEVLYNNEFYESLHTLLENQLKDTGYIVIATKDTYFGLSGSLYRWLEFIEEKNSFYPADIIKVCKTNIPRTILIMRRLQVKENTEQI